MDKKRKAFDKLKKMPTMPTSLMATASLDPPEIKQTEELKEMWLINWENESGDRGSYLYEGKKKPSKKYIEDFFKQNHPDEFEDFDCYINWEIAKPRKIPLDKNETTETS